MLRREHSEMAIIDPAETARIARRLEKESRRVPKKTVEPSPVQKRALALLLSEETLARIKAAILRSGGISKSDAEDIRQEVLIKAERAISNGSYEERDTFLPWLNAIIKYACLDHYRQEKRHTHEEIDFKEASPHIPQELWMKQRDLGIMIARLPELEQKVVALRREGLSGKEVASRLSLEEKQVNKLFFRAKRRLENERRLEP